MLVPDSETRTSMAGATVYPLSRYGLVCFSGGDAQSFLHSQLTCDVNSLTPGWSTYGSCCTPQGRVLASFLLWRSEQGYFMQLPSPLRESVQRHLSKFVLRSKVKLTDASGDWTLIGVAGGDSGGLVQRAIGRQAPQALHEVAHMPGATAIHLPLDRFEIVAARDRARAIWDALAAEARSAHPEHWEWLDIRAGVPVITAATQEQFVPQMVNLDVIGGVSFTKGCYPGQEIVARMHYLGRLKQRMYLAHLATSDRPRPGDKLYSTGLGERSSGMIVNAARSPEGGHDALAVIQIESAQSGKVHWKTLDGPALELLTLPYKV